MTATTTTILWSTRAVNLKRFKNLFDIYFFPSNFFLLLKIDNRKSVIYRLPIFYFYQKFRKGAGIKRSLIRNELFLFIFVKSINFIIL